jgi:hypothetical protein
MYSCSHPAADLDSKPETDYDPRPVIVLYCIVYSTRDRRLVALATLQKPVGELNGPDLRFSYADRLWPLVPQNKIKIFLVATKR